LTDQTNSHYFLCIKTTDGTIVVPNSEKQKLIKGNEMHHVRSNQGTNQEDQCKIEELSEDNI